MVNGFLKAGIAGALDGQIDSRPEEDARDDESESEEYDSDQDDDSRHNICTQTHTF